MFARGVGRRAIAGRPAALAACTALALFAGGSPAALAHSASEPPEYSLSIVEGESTQPEYAVAHTSARAHPSKSIAVSIVHDGVIAARGTGEEGVWLPQVPQVGDVVTVEAPIETVVASVVYDGLPTLDPTVCAGSANLSGQRTAGQTVSAGYYSLELRTDHYGNSSLHETASGQAQVTALNGNAFSGSFLAPLTLGQTVQATESLQTPLAGGATFTYSSENDRPVQACPVPPAPPPPPPAPPALQGSIFKLLRTTIHKLLGAGAKAQITINQPGTVVADLYAQGGALPAYASRATRRRRHKRKPLPALLLARGSATAGAAGTVTVTLHVTAQGRRRLAHAKSAKGTLVATLRSAAGARLTLPHRTVTLHR